MEVNDLRDNDVLIERLFENCLTPRKDLFVNAEEDLGVEHVLNLEETEHTKIYEHK
jgi:hypothetical protein